MAFAGATGARFLFASKELHEFRGLVGLGRGFAAPEFLFLLRRPASPGAATET